MADVSKTVEIIFSTTLADSGSALQSLGSGIESFADKAQAAVAPLNKLADVVKVTDTAIVALGLAIGVKAVEAAGRFNQSMTEIGTLFNGTKDQVSTLSQEVIAYASTSTQSYDSITGAVYNAISAGVDYTKSVQFLSEVEKLAVAGKGDLNATTLALVGTMNAYGASTDQASKYADYLMKTVQIGQTELPQLAQSLSQVTSTAAAAGIGFDQVAAAVAALTAYGIPTEQAMTSLKAAIGNIITPSKEATDLAAKLGISFGATALQSKGLAGVLQEVQTATGGNIEQIATLFGSMEALKGVTALSSDQSGIYAKALDAMKNSAGTTDAAFRAMQGTFDNVAQSVKNGIDTMMIALGQPLQDEFFELSQAIKNLFGGLTIGINEGTFDPVFETLGVISDRLVAFMNQIAANLPEALEMIDFTKFNSSLINLADSLGGMFDGVDLSTPEGLADAIQTVVDSIANLINTGAGIAQTWGDAIDAMIPLIQEFANMDQATATTSGRVLGFGDILNTILPAIGAVGSAMEALGLAAETVGGIQLTKFVTGMSSLPEIVGKAGFAIGTFIGVLGQAGLVGAAGAAGYAVGTVLSNGIDYVVGKLTGGSSLGSLIYDLVHGNEDLAESAPKASTAVKQVGDAASEAASPMTDFKNNLKEAEAQAEATGITVGGKLVSEMIAAAQAAGEAATKAEFLAKAQAAIKEPTEANVKLMNEAARVYKDTATSTDNLATASAVIRAEYEKLHPQASQVNDKLKTSAGVMEELASKTNLTNKELIDLAKLAKEAEVKLEQIASNERIKNMEMTMKLNIANVEANARIAQAAIESIVGTFEADTKLIADLLGQLGDGFSEADKVRIDLANEANKRINELHDAQMKLIQAQVEYMSAKTAAMASGNPVVTIQAGGLQPHLEAFMWEILKQIQVKMAYDGGDMLVGGCSL